MIINNVNIKYGDNIIYKDFNIEFENDKINCISGASGCGKTTLLNYIANELIERGVSISYIFQTDNLIPWKNIHDNLEFIGKKYFKKDRLEKEIDNFLEITELSEFKYYYPNELSGGMRQRVNFIRALLVNFDVLLMDEPFKSLDINCKNKLMNVIKVLSKERNVTIIMVTHNEDEIKNLAQKVFLFEGKPVKIAKTSNF